MTQSERRRRVCGGSLRPSGFTLIELLVVVAMVAILAAIAYPSYEEQVRKARRADAKAALVELAQVLERRYTETGRYTDTAGNAVPLPYTEAPREGSVKYYDLALAAASQNAFTLRATPKGAQAGDAKCTAFTLTHRGEKGAEGTDAAHCW